MLPRRGIFLFIKIILLLCIIFSFCLHVSAQQKRIYIAPDEHIDYMWDGTEEMYRVNMLNMLDYYLNQMDATDANPPYYQSRWNCDGSFWMWTYEKNRTQTQFDRFINRIRDGHLNVAMNPLVILNGGTPAEAVIRGMYYPGLIERRYNVRFPIAISMENMTLPYGLGSLWSGCGVKWSWKGVCGCATRVPDIYRRQHDIYYHGGPDGSKVLMKWHYLYGGYYSGGYAESRYPELSLDYVTSNPDFTSHYPYLVVGLFGYGGDAWSTQTNAPILTAQNYTNAARQVIVSNQQDFFQDFETNYGTSIPTLNQTYGNEWELLVASMAEESARVKRSIEKLRTAEGLATLVSIQNPAFMNTRIQSRDKAMLNFGLYFEHDWTADGDLPRSDRANWQRLMINEIESYVNTLHTDAATSLGNYIRRTGTNQRFYVFNPLSWARTDYADFPYSDTNPVHVIDLSTGYETPSQIVMIDGQRRLRIYAENVPSVGYKVFEVRAGQGASFPLAGSINGNLIETYAHRITVSNSGAITSLIDKLRGNREFVRTINGKTINDLGGTDGTLEIENMGPVSVTLKTTSSTPIAHTTRITVFRDSPRIDIRNDITQNFGNVQTWSFSFDLNAPEVMHEEVGAIIKARLTNDGGHYATQNSRYDWLTMNHFADISNGSLGVTISNADCYYMKLGNSTVTSLDTATPQINVLAGGQVDGPTLGIPNQGGASQFMQRFALNTHDAFNQVAAMKFSLEHQNPFVTGNVTGGSAYPDNSFSLVSINNPNALLWTLKPAEDGISNGVVARVWNMSNSASSFTFSLPFNLSQAKRTTHIETDIASVPIGFHSENSSSINGLFADSINQNQIRTYRFMFSPTVTTASIGGRVTTPNGTPIPNVSVTLNNISISQSFSVTTNSQGFYSFPSIPTGNTVIITPSRNGIIFSPSSESFTHFNDRSDINFISNTNNIQNIAVFNDFDGDRKTDVSVFRPSQATWYILRSNDNSFLAQNWGAGSDRIVPADYDGDGKTDVAVWRPSNGVYYILQSSNGILKAVQFGLSNDLPVYADFDGDGKHDVSVWRPSTGVFYVINSSDGSFTYKVWGVNGDVPVVGDYDSDGKSDYAVWRPSDGNWYVLQSSNNLWLVRQFGTNGDKPDAGDYDGDGKNDFVVFRPSTGVWYISKSSDNSFFAAQFGTSTDRPASGDFDGDGKFDITVWRPSSGIWYIWQSSNNAFRFVGWGLNGDTPTTFKG